VTSERLEAAYREGMTLAEAVQAAVSALAGPERSLEPRELEVAVLARSNGRRAFRRLTDEQLAEMLG
jgi:proteasome alpha subunit